MFHYFESYFALIECIHLVTVIVVVRVVLQAKLKSGALTARPTWRFQLAKIETLLVFIIENRAFEYELKSSIF